MKEYPILFKGEMVRAILDGRKTMTRRIPDCRNAKWQVGNRLWVKEMFYEYGYYEYIDGADFKDYPWHGSDKIEYCADGFVPPTLSAMEETYNCMWRKKPSLFMRRTGSRITLEITAIREEALQDITEQDAMAEGVAVCLSARNSFKSLWDAINAKRGYSWAGNPIVKVIEFRRVK